MSSGHGDNGGTGDLNTGILQQILAALGDIAGRVDQTNVRLEVGFRDVNERLDQTNARLDQTNERLDQTNARLDQTNERLDQTNARLDNLIALSGSSWRDLERRVAVLEAHFPAKE